MLTTDERDQLATLFREHYDGWKGSASDSSEALERVAAMNAIHDALRVLGYEIAWQNGDRSSSDHIIVQPIVPRWPAVTVFAATD